MAPRPPRGASATSDAASDDPFPDDEFPPRSAEKEDEDKKLADAVARGKAVLWPVTFLSTLGIGVGCSVGGIVKTKGWTNRFYFHVFVATLVGWLVLLVIQLAVMNELYTKRRSRNSKVVVALAMAFGGWVSGFFVAILVVVMIWRPAAEGDGAGTLLIVQAILGVGSSLVGFYFYFEGYVRPVRKSRPHFQEKRQIRPPHRQARDAIKRGLSGSSRTSKASRRSNSSRTQVDSSTRGSSCSSRPSSSDLGSLTSKDSHDGGWTSHSAASFKSADSASGPESTNTDVESHTSDDGYPPRSVPQQRNSRTPSSLPPLPTPPVNALASPRGAPPPPPGALRVPVRVDSAGQPVRKGVPATTLSTPVNSQTPASLRPGAGRSSYRPYPPTGPSRPAYDTVAPAFQGPPRWEASSFPISASKYPEQPVYTPVPNSSASSSSRPNHTGRISGTSPALTQYIRRKPLPIRRKPLPHGPTVEALGRAPSGTSAPVSTPQAPSPQNPDALPPMPLYQPTH